MNIHIVSVHDDKKPFECKICESKFDKEYDLKIDISWNFELMGSMPFWEKKII